MSEIKAYILSMAEAAQRYREYAMPLPREKKYAGNGLVNPPLDMGKLASFYDDSTWHRNAVRVKARDITGHDWRLAPEFEEGREPSGAVRDRETLDAFFWNGAVETFTEITGVDDAIPLPSSLTEVMERVLIDTFTIGNGYLVVIREDRASGPPTWYAHIQGSPIMLHRDRLRYRWREGGTSHWFKRFGLEADVHIKTGEIYELGSLPLLDRAPEIIHFRTYSPTDNYYGVPDVTPAIGAIVMELLARDYNIKFFDNNAIPQYAVVLEGADELDSETKQTIETFFSTTAKDNPHSTLVLSTPSSADGETKQTITFEKLAVDVKEGHFRLLREDSRNEVLSAHAVPAYRLGIAIEGNLGGTNIREADEVYKYQEVDTHRSALEERINRQLIRQGFGIESWSLRFNELDISDDLRQVERWTRLVDGGLATPNQAIEALVGQRVEDRPELDEYYYRGRPWGDILGGDTGSLFREREDLADMIMERVKRNV